MIFLFSLWAMTSPNYLQSVKCFPVLKSESLAKSFSLGALKDLIDEKFPLLNEKLLTRDIYFTRDGKKRVMRLKPQGQTFQMAVEEFNEKLEWVPVSGLQKPKALQSDINQQLLNVELTSDEKTYDDTKLNNHQLSYKLIRKEVVELVFRRQGAKEKLYCYVKEDVGPLCICK